MTILIADRDHRFRQELADWVRDQKHEVLEAINGEHAIDQCYRRLAPGMRSVDLVIIDFDIDFIPLVRQTAPTPLVCIMVTELVTMENTCGHIGADWVMARSCKREDLKEKLGL